MRWLDRLQARFPLDSALLVPSRYKSATLGSPQEREVSPRLSKFGFGYGVSVIWSPGLYFAQLLPSSLDIAQSLSHAPTARLTYSSNDQTRRHGVIYRTDIELSDWLVVSDHGSSLLRATAETVLVPARPHSRTLPHNAVP